jgi:hypothetical protein
VLQPVLAGDRPSCSYRELATRLGITEGAVKVEVHRLRHRFGAALRAEIGTTVADPEEIDDELRYLLPPVAGAGMRGQFRIGESVCRHGRDPCPAERLLTQVPPWILT